MDRKAKLALPALAGRAAAVICTFVLGAAAVSGAADPDGTAAKPPAYECHDATELRAEMGRNANLYERRR